MRQYRIPPQHGLLALVVVGLIVYLLVSVPVGVMSESFERLGLSPLQGAAVLMAMLVFRTVSLPLWKSRRLVARPRPEDMAQGLGPLEAAVLAVWAHGRAGDRAAQRLGEVSSRQGLYNEAEEHYLRAIAILAEEEPESPWVGRATIGLARVYREAGRLEAAEASYLRGLELMKNGWGASDPDYLEAAAELQALLDAPPPS